MKGTDRCQYLCVSINKLLLCSWHTIFLFCSFSTLQYVLYVIHKLNFIMPSSRLSCDSYSLFTLPFLSKQTGHGRNIISFYFFLFISGRAKCLSREQCGVRTVTEQQGRKLDDQWVLTVMKSPTGEKCHQHSSAVTAIIPYLRTIKLQYTLLGDYWECVWPARLPVLTWVPSSVPLGTISKIRSLTGSTQDTTVKLEHSGPEMLLPHDGTVKARPFGLEEWCWTGWH